MTSIINATSASHTAIKNDLEQFVKGLPEGIQWQDWLESSDGSIIRDWIAGLATFVSYQSLANRYESSLQFAQLSSSISEHALNRGFCTAPTESAELSFTIAVDESHYLEAGALIGYIADYGMYTLDDYTLEVGTPETIEVVLGKLTEFEKDITGISEFTTIEVDITGEYAATQLETIDYDGTPINLLSELNYIEGALDKSTFMLRRATTNIIYLFVGNGSLGWYDSEAKTLSYKILSYDSDINDALTASPSPVTGYTLTDKTILKKASFTLSKEELRVTALYFPLDGRINTDSDYEAIIFKYFGGVLHDIFSENTDPEQYVYLLKKADYFVEEHLTQIQNLVDSKRALGMKVNYVEVEPDTGETYHATFYVEKGREYAGLYDELLNYLHNKLFIFMHDETTITTAEWAVELTDLVGFKVFPDDTNSITLDKISFFKDITIEIDAREIRQV